MPNHVRNVIKFKNLKPDDIAMILNTLATEIPDRPDINYAIDFDKIIPEPRTIEDCPEDCRVTEKSHIVKDEDRDWFDWYAWHNKYWGTKWNAYDCYSIIGKSFVTFVFSTAWSYPEPIIDRLHLLGYDIEYRYAEEDWGSNCGRMTYTSEQGWETQDEYTGLPHPEQFAKRLWDRY